MQLPVSPSHYPLYSISPSVYLSNLYRSPDVAVLFLYLFTSYHSLLFPSYLFPSVYLPFSHTHWHSTLPLYPSDISIQSIYLSFSRPLPVSLFTNLTPFMFYLTLPAFPFSPSLPYLCSYLSLPLSLSPLLYLALCILI